MLVELYGYRWLQYGCSAGTPLRDPTLSCQFPSRYAFMYSFHERASFSSISTALCVAGSQRAGNWNSPKMRTFSGLTAFCQKKPVGATTMASARFQAYPRGEAANA